MHMKFKYNKEFREAHPETKGEKDSTFDLVNYTEWLEDKVGQIEPLVMPKIAELEEDLYSARMQLKEQQEEIEMLKHENKQLNEQHYNRI